MPLGFLSVSDRILWVSTTPVPRMLDKEKD